MTGRGESCSSLASGSLDDLEQMLPGLDSPTAVAEEVLTTVFGETRAFAFGVFAAEAANGDSQLNGVTSPGQVSGTANVTIVNAGADRMAGRTAGAVTNYLRIETGDITIEDDPVDRQR